MEMIFKLQSNITRVKLFIHHNYFEWAPCIETFGFFAKCDSDVVASTRAWLYAR